MSKRKIGIILKTCFLLGCIMMFTSCASNSTEYSLSGKQGIIIHISSYPIQLGESLLNIHYPNMDLKSDKISITAIHQGNSKPNSLDFQALSDETSGHFTAIIELPTTGAWGLNVVIQTKTGIIQDHFDIDVVNTPTPVAVLADDFILQNLDGKEIKLSELRGKPVIINFWATWCQPCRNEMPLLEEAYKIHNEMHGLVILGVNVEESASDIKKFVADVKVSFPILLDTSGTVSDLYQAKALPLSVFISADGYVAHKHFGELTPDILEKYLALIMPEHTMHDSP